MAFMRDLRPMLTENRPQHACQKTAFVRVRSREFDRIVVTARRASASSGLHISARRIPAGGVLGVARIGRAHVAAIAAVLAAACRALACRAGCLGALLEVH